MGLKPFAAITEALAVVICLGLLLPPSAAAARITLSTGEDQSNDRSAYLNSLLTECFCRMDVDINIEVMPHKRALEAARLAKADGTFIRSKLIGETYPELVMVPVPLISSKVTIFTTDPSLLTRLNGWESLAPYRVAYISGWHWVDLYLPPCKEAHQIKKKESLLLFLAKDRADVAIYEEGLGNEEIRRRELEGIYVQETPLSVAHMYLYMHSQHSDMIPEIEKTLREMEADGTLRALRLKHHQQ